MTQIKFGTDGWRAIIADDYTVYNVMRVAEATAQWILAKGISKPKVIIGYDCRFGGKLFLHATARVFGYHGIISVIDPSFISTPTVSLVTLQLKAAAGIVITASHNPPTYNGFKIKDSFGGPANPAEIAKVEALIPDTLVADYESFETYVHKGLVHYDQLEEMYIKAIKKGINFELINKSNLELAYDAMYGAGQKVMRELLPDATFLHCEYNPSFDGQAPEPIHNNLSELSELIQIAEDIDLGIATDGDADRIGLYNSSGKFIDSHHIILLLIQYLHKYKGMGGKVVNSFSCTGKIKNLCDHYGLKHQVTKIGFKYICDTMITEDVLIGGEESGGIAIKGHIPERDGIWIGLTILEFMAVTGKSLDELIEEVYDITGSFAVERYDLQIDEYVKLKVIEKCKNKAFTAFGKFNIESEEDMDGFKYHLGEGRWLMIRPSGTEPVLRIYAEAENSAKAFEILDITQRIISNTR